MDFIKLFQEFLFSQTPQPSRLTVKNYLSDIRRFSRWYEARFKHTFTPEAITYQILGEYIKQDQQEKPGKFHKRENAQSSGYSRSMERYISSLRKFFSFLSAQSYISSNPFDLLIKAKEAEKEKDTWKLHEFRQHLYRTNASPITIKNYIIDMQQFFHWIETAIGEIDHYDLKEKNLFTHITPFLLEEYKRRLLSEAKAAPSTINRKLSSLRRYLAWASEQGYTKPFTTEDLPTHLSDKTTTQPSPIESDIPQNEEPLTEIGFIMDETTELALLPDLPETTTEPVVPTYSRFPPLRLLQRLGRAGTVVSDAVIILPLATIMDRVSYVTWKIKGSQVFVPQNPMTVSKRVTKVLDTTGFLKKTSVKKPKMVASLPKSFYAPLAISLRHAPLHKKVWFHVRHTRPSWYKAYHSYAFVNYLHAAILVICMSAGGFGIVQAMTTSGENTVAFASLPEGPPRLLSFKGRLTRVDASPITAQTNLRFSIYNDQAASGAAQLWQEVENVHPDQDGNFSVMLGSTRSIPQRLFEENARLYIGMSIETSPELTPRKQIPTEVLAATADTLQGLRPITDPQSDQKNAILALDSAGNLTIGGKINPEFKATGGQFTLAGQMLILTTTAGTNGDVRIEPDGEGRIDFRKPIHNTSEDISTSGLTGAVEIEDSVAITASQSGQSALQINQNSTGSLISASSSGIAKFTVDNTGYATFGDSVMVYGNSLSTTQTSFNLLTTNPINLSIGTSATSLSLGGTGGVATINNSQTVLSGNLNVNGTTGLTFTNAAAGISFSGQGAHLISASSGSLQLGTATLTGNLTVAKDISILPAGTDGTNDLGSASNPFDSLYVTNIISPSIPQAYWVSQNGALSPNSLTTSIMIGSTASTSAAWQVFGSGANAGTASSSGNLSFTGQHTTVNQLNGGSLTFQTSPGGEASLTPRVTIANNGNVGIGTSNPGSRLDLDTGTGVAFNWVSTSSKRYKNDITAIRDPLGTIGKLQGVYYTWDQTHGGQRGLGFIAEDVGKVVPEVVEWEADGVHAKGISYGNLTALAIEGIKAQQEQINRITDMVKTFGVLPNESLSLKETGNLEYAVETETGEQVKTKAGFAQAVIGMVESGMSLTRYLQTNVLKAESGTINALMANSITSPYLNVGDLTVTGTIKATQGVILSLQTDSIQSSQPNSLLSLALGANQLVVYGVSHEQKSPVAMIDTVGNASFAGLVTAHNVTAEQQVTARKIVAEELEMSDEGYRKLAAHIMSHLDIDQSIAKDNYTSQNTPPMPAPSAAPSATSEASMTEEITPDASPSAVTTESLVASGVTSDYTDIASAEASLNIMPVATPYTTSNSETLLGAPLPSGAGTVLADVSVADTLSVGGNLILSDQSIDVVGGDLQIQPLRSGSVSFMAGLVTINPSGDLTVSGNAFFAHDITVKGRLATNIISPVDSEELVVKLGDNHHQTGALAIQNAQGQTNLKITDQGDLASQGKATFSQMASESLSIVRGVQADASPVTTVASSSAGMATILPGQTQRTIVTPFVTSKSLVYLTPIADTQGMVPYVSRQTPEDPAHTSQGSFTIEINDTVTKPIKVNWWIVN